MNKGNKNIFDETVDTLIKDAKALTERYNKYVSAEADPDNCAFRNKMTIDTLRLLKDTLSLIKEYDWHLEYSEYETDGHNEITVWEQNHSGEIRNYKKWTIGNTTIYIDYGTDVTVVYANRRKYHFDLKKDKEAFINMVDYYLDRGNTTIYVDDNGLGKYVCDLLDSHDIIYHLIRNMNSEE